MYYSENIGKIKNFFTEENNDEQAEYVSDFDNGLKCKVLALLLVNSDLATPELNRHNVKLLLDGGIAWPKDDGSKYRADIKVELGLLERLGAITFYANYCKVHSRRLSDYGAINDSVKPIFDALELLKNILYGNGYVKPYFHINKQYAQKLIEKSSIFIKLDDFKGVVSEGENYRLDLDGFRHDNLLPEFLWKEVVTSLDLNIDINYSAFSLNETQINVLNKWLLICRVYSDNYLVSINFKYIKNECKRIFLDFFEPLLIDDKQLIQPEYILKNKWRCNSRIEDMFFEIDRSIHMNISSSGASSVSHSNKLPVPLSMDSIQSKFFTPEAVVDTSCLVFVRDWARNGRHINNDNRLYTSLLMQFVKSDIYIDDSSLNSYGRLDNLLEKSAERAEIRHILLNELPIYSGIKYLLYLLAKKETATAAVYLFANKSPYNLIALPRGESGTYHLKFFPVICDEFLELHFNNEFDRIYDKDVVELLILMAEDSIYNNYSGELSCTKDCLDILLERFSTEQVSYFAECLFEEIEKGFDVTGKIFPVSKIYLLFWLLERTQDFNLSNESDLSSKVQLLITKFYVTALKRNIDNKDNKLDAYKLFDFLPWWRIDDEYISEYLQLIKKPTNWVLKLTDSNSCQYQNKMLTRSYLQLLIGLHSEKRAVDKNDPITLKVLGLLESCGFPEYENKFCGLFDYESRYDYCLWQQFVLLVDDMSDSSFDRVLSILETGAPINRALELYEKVNKEARKEKILVHIKSPSEEKNDSLGIEVLEESLDSACRTGQVDIAKIMLDRGLSLLNDEDSYLKKRLPSTQISILEDKWCAYEFKINLLMVVSDDALSNEKKLEMMRDFEQPFRREKNNQVRLQLAGSCNRFKRNMSALILHEINPEAAYKCYHGLYLEDNNDYYSGNRFS
ncbi:MAG: hypothetical protein RPR97_00330, partial [Colwellia sp.]